MITSIYTPEKRRNRTFNKKKTHYGMFQEKDIPRHISRKRHTTAYFEKKTYHSIFLEKDRAHQIMKKDVSRVMPRIQISTLTVKNMSGIKKNISRLMSRTKIKLFKAHKYV